MECDILDVFQNLSGKFQLWLSSEKSDRYFALKNMNICDSSLTSS
jgi:hypothetical protein